MIGKWRKYKYLYRKRAREHPPKVGGGSAIDSGLRPTTKLALLVLVTRNAKIITAIEAFLWRSYLNMAKNVLTINNN